MSLLYKSVYVCFSQHLSKPYLLLSLTLAWKDTLVRIETLVLHLRQVLCNSRSNGNTATVSLFSSTASFVSQVLTKVNQVKLNSIKCNFTVCFSVSTPAWQPDGCEFNSRLGEMRGVCKFPPGSCCVCAGVLLVLQVPPTFHRRNISSLTVKRHAAGLSSAHQRREALWHRFHEATHKEVLLVASDRWN